MKPPLKRAAIWWQRGLVDGKHCAHRRRARFFFLYLEKATEAFNPGDLLGPFECVYRTAFRYGYDAEKLARETRNNYFPRPRKSGKLQPS